MVYILLHLYADERGARTGQRVGVQLQLPIKEYNVMTQENLKKINLLMVEDNEVDVVLTREILSETERAAYQVNAVKDGIEALMYLRRSDGYKNAPKPDLILLDLHLPRMNGHELLTRIKADQKLKTIPICIFTTSETKEDREKAKGLQADGYLTKPMNLQEFEETIAGIF
jgi:CheY-like chemotaxis protein